jgi:hypothetical protein
MQEFNNMIDGVGPAVCAFQLAFGTVFVDQSSDELAVSQWPEEALMEKHK